LKRNIRLNRLAEPHYVASQGNAELILPRSFSTAAILASSGVAFDRQNTIAPHFRNLRFQYAACHAFVGFLFSDSLRLLILLDPALMGTQRTCDLHSFRKTSISNPSSDFTIVFAAGCNASERLAHCQSIIDARGPYSS
jgi:hypothetical protein